jgi:hypothetical protein
MPCHRILLETNILLRQLQKSIWSGLCRVHSRMSSPCASDRCGTWAKNPKLKETRLAESGSQRTRSQPRQRCCLDDWFPPWLLIKNRTSRYKEQTTTPMKRSSCSSHIPQVILCVERTNDTLSKTQKISLLLPFPSTSTEFLVDIICGETFYGIIADQKEQVSFGRSLAPRLVFQ